MNERVTVTLPAELVREIDRHERNRSKFVLHSVQRELDRRRRNELRRSLRKPHVESGWRVYLKETGIWSTLRRARPCAGSPERAGSSNNVRDRGQRHARCLG